MNSFKYIKKLVPILLIIGICPIFLGTFLFSTHWDISHDILSYIARIPVFVDALNHGILIPRIAPDFCGGYGYPVFVFYQPALFYLWSIMHFIGFELPNALHVTVLIAFIYGGTGSYLLAKKISGNVYGSFFAAIVFLLTPYLYCNLHVRGDFSELLSILVGPMAMYAVLELYERIKEKRKYVFCFGLTAAALALIITSHPAGAVFIFAPMSFIIGYTVIFSNQYAPLKERIFTLTIIAASFVFALILSSPYWFITLIMKQHIQYERILKAFVSTDHAVSFWQLFSNKWGFGSSIPGYNDNMSFQLGLPHFILAIFGMIIGYKKRIIQIAALLYFIFIVLMLPCSAFLWENIEVLRSMHFPWRALTGTVFVQYIAICGVACFVNRRKLRTTHIAIYSIIILSCSAVWYEDMFSSKKMFLNIHQVFSRLSLEASRHNCYPHDASGEFYPKSVVKYPITPRGNSPLIMISGRDTVVKPLPGNSKYHLHYQLTTKEPAILVIKQFYLPGWKVYLGGKLIEDKVLSQSLAPTGLMCLHLKAPVKKLELKAFYQPPGERMLIILIAITVTIWLLLVLKSSQWGQRVFQNAMKHLLSFSSTKNDKKS